MNPVPFCKPHITQNSLDYMAQCCASGMLQGGGLFSAQSASLIEQKTGAIKVLLTSSCTDALEMAALLLDLQLGDEIIMPSYTFPSSATAFVLRGAVPVFVDIRPDTINIDENLIESAITPKTKAILIVHYAGVSCAMERIQNIAQRHNIVLVEDAAHAYGADYKGKALGSFGTFGTYSFHNSKNISSGEGGALLINDSAYIHRAEILHEKGTDRSRFVRGDTAFYTWQDVGSSFLMSDVTAALLLGQIEVADEINARRLQIWNTYHEALKDLENQSILNRPVVPDGCTHNAHLYYILLRDKKAKEVLLQKAKKQSIGIISHYVPLHGSPAGLKFGRTASDMKFTDDITNRLVRLPLYADLQEDDISRVLSCVLGGVRDQ